VLAPDLIDQAEKEAQPHGGIRVALAGATIILTRAVNKMLKSKTSMRKLTLSGIVFACGMAGTVQAANLGSGPVYGGPGQSHVACQVANVGNTAITLRSTYHNNVAHLKAHRLS